MPIYPYQDKLPSLGAGVFLAPSAELAGEIEAGEDCSFWFHTAARGDVNWIRIGARTNVQDGTVLHVTHERFPLLIGADVVIGHSCMIHGCTLEDACLIGIGARILDGAVVESGAQVGAGAVVPPGNAGTCGAARARRSGQARPPALRLGTGRHSRDRPALRPGQGRVHRDARQGLLRIPTMTQRFQAPKGTRDILPADTALWAAVEAAARAVFGRYGFREIRTPIFEETELFARGVGESSDIVGKEMYSFVDKGERHLTLRPENTASVVRAYVEHGMHRQPQPVKLFYIGPQFRYERPQKGRYRQFHQIGAELLGR